MRRVVVTGLGMVTPLGCGVEADVAAPARRRERRAPHREVRRLRPARQDRLPDPARRRLRRHLQSRPVDGAEGAAQGRRVHHLSRCARPRQALDDAGWKPTSYEDQIATGVLIGSGIGGIEGIAETAIMLKERGPRRVSPFFIPGRLINLASGYVSIEHGLKGPNHAVVTACSTGAHAIGDAGAADRARRCRRDGGGRHRIAGQPHLDGGLCRLPGAVDRLQRHADARLAALRQGPRRLRDGRGRRRRGARGTTSTPSAAAPRSMPSWSATACRATPTTSPRRPRTATARSAA